MGTQKVRLGRHGDASTRGANLRRHDVTLPQPRLGRNEGGRLYHHGSGRDRSQACLGNGAAPSTGLRVATLSAGGGPRREARRQSATVTKAKPTTAIALQDFGDTEKITECGGQGRVQSY
ncbi:hypothetical protein T484DRAFT_1924338 [Baffinella frigidus]|nr:hypothetical protein T484DRAFT_1924338 [Cryptophyta sp. CCMP2293]